MLPGSEPRAVAGLVEKPDIDKAPSNFASIGRYVLTPDIFDIIVSNQLVLVERSNWLMRLTLKQQVMRLKRLY